MEKLVNIKAKVDERVMDLVEEVAIEFNLQDGDVDPMSAEMLDKAKAELVKFLDHFIALNS